MRSDHCVILGRAESAGPGSMTPGCDCGFRARHRGNTRDRLAPRNDGA
jgi:hypothetical protein